MFEVMTAENSARVVLNDNRTGYSEAWVIGRGHVALAHAIYAFARQRGISVRRVGYSVTVEG